jgi:hypothetical protein
MEPPTGPGTGTTCETIDSAGRYFWEPSLLIALGRAARRQGAFTVALARWDRAWTVTRDEATANGRLLAGEAMAERLGLAADLGHVEMLRQALRAVGDRSFIGRSQAALARARGVLAILETHPESVVSCGRQALALLWRARSSQPVPAILTQAGDGIMSLADVPAGPLARRRVLDDACRVRA